ncbi:hypothetical protein C8F01DRAFT_1322246 [Mycena amicta]|nr:hypothetical protein C8F01DRAFT_1322246 [Mycena amicta]
MFLPATHRGGRRHECRKQGITATEETLNFLRGITECALSAVDDARDGGSSGGDRIGVDAELGKTAGARGREVGDFFDGGEQAANVGEGIWKRKTMRKRHFGREETRRTGTTQMRSLHYNDGISDAVLALKMRYNVQRCGTIDRGCTEYRYTEFRRGTWVKTRCAVLGMTKHAWLNEVLYWMPSTSQPHVSNGSFLAFFGAGTDDGGPASAERLLVERALRRVNTDDTASTAAVAHIWNSSAVRAQQALKQTTHLIMIVRGRNISRRGVDGWGVGGSKNRVA